MTAAITQGIAELRAYLATVRGSFAAVVRPPFYLDQIPLRAWALARALILPAILASAAIGITLQLHAGTVLDKVGAQARSSGMLALGIIKQLTPVSIALITAGVGVSATCADIGSRKVREEIDALEALSVRPLHYLGGPTIVAYILVLPFVSVLGAASGIVSSAALAIGLRGVNAGTYLDGLLSVITYRDIMTALVLRPMIFGAMAATIAIHMGMRAQRGAIGVGRAVNSSVVLAGMMVFVVDYLIGSLLFVSGPRVVA